MKTLKVKRVSYAKKDTPIQLREYRINGSFNSPVGTKEDWKEFAKQHDYGMIIFEEKDGKTWSQFIFGEK